jgi:hypothetical protein
MAMARPREPWNIRPAKRRGTVPASLRTEVETKARNLIQNVLKPRCVKPPTEDEQFNYITDITAKWFRNNFYFVSTCGEEIVTPLDISQGSSQEYVEDCPVCCRANLIHVEIDEQGNVRAWAELE